MRWPLAPAVTAAYGPSTATTLRDGSTDLSNRRPLLSHTPVPKVRQALDCASILTAGRRSWTLRLLGV